MEGFSSGGEEEEGPETRENVRRFGCFLERAKSRLGRRKIAIKSLF